MWLQSRFSCISHFLCSRTHRKYEKWVILGLRIKIFIQQVLSLKIWVKSYGDMLKIQVEKVVLYFFIFLPFYSKNSESSPTVDIIILNPIGCYKFDFFIHFCFEAHFLPQTFSNVHGKWEIREKTWLQSRFFRSF